MIETETDRRPINKRLIDKFGFKPSECSCSKCVQACKVCPCACTPDDVYDIVVNHGISRDLFSTTLNLMYFECGIVSLPVPVIGLKGETHRVEEGIYGVRCNLLTDNGKCLVHEFKPLGGRYGDTHEGNPFVYMSSNALEFQTVMSWVDRDNIDRISEAAKVICKTGNEYIRFMEAIHLCSLNIKIVRDKPELKDLLHYSTRLKSLMEKMEKSKL